MDQPKSRTLGNLIVEMAARFPDREAMVFRDQRITYRQFEREVEKRAQALTALGVVKGERVAVLFRNSPDWLYLYFAVTSIGAIFVGVSTWSQEKELDYVLRHCDASTFFLVDRFLKNDYSSQIKSILPAIKESDPGTFRSEKLPFLKNVIFWGQDKPRGAIAYEEFCRMGEKVGDAHLEKTRAEVMPWDLAQILYTSGTTSFPKGVMHVHEALVMNGYQIGEHQVLNENDRAWLYFPLFFSAGCCNVTLGTVTHGACLVFQETFEPGEALKLMEREKCTTFHAWPNTVRAIMEHPDYPNTNLSHLHKGTGPWDLLMGLKHADGIGGVNMYGMTETCTACACTRGDDPPEIRIKTQGHPFPGVEFKIVNETGERVQPGEVGEICVKGFNVMKGYYKKDPAETFDAEGFFHTGDRGKIDDRGFFRFKSRITEMIKTGGLNVSPLEVESYLTTHPKVIHVHVLGIPDPVKEERVGVVIVPKEGVECTAEEIREFCKGNISSYKIPEMIEFMKEEELPLTATGKVQKHKLLEILQSRKIG